MPLNEIQQNLTGRYISHVYFFRPELSHRAIMFDLVTLTLKFDLLFKNFNLGRNFQTRRAKVFIMYMCIPCDKAFHVI